MASNKNKLSPIVKAGWVVLIIGLIIVGFDEIQFIFSEMVRGYNDAMN